MNADDDIFGGGDGDGDGMNLDVAGTIDSHLMEAEQFDQDYVDGGIRDDVSVTTAAHLVVKINALILIIESNYRFYGFNCTFFSSSLIKGMVLLSE